MKQLHKNFGIQGRCVARPRRLGWAAALTLFFLLLGISPLAAAPHRLVLNKVYITDVTGSSFVVSWTTDEATNGYVEWRELPADPWNTANDTVSDDTTTHYVTVSGLDASTTYEFQVTSDTITDDNGGSYYSVTTGASIASSPGKLIWGYVYEFNGTTPVPNAVVYLQIQDVGGAGTSGNSQWVSARTGSNGVWQYSLNDVRTPSANAYYIADDGTDNLRLIVQGGALGCVGETGNLRIETVPSSYPAQFNTTLDNTSSAVTLVKLESQSKAPFFGSSALLIGLCVVAGLVVLYPQKK